MRVLVTGGSGDLGRRLVPLLEKAGHTVLVGTRHPTEANHVHYDLSADPAPEILEGVDVLVHLATDGVHPDHDVTGSARLWKAVARSGVAHVVFTSIVGIDDHPFPYYRAKKVVEEQLEESGLPYTILRATQFHTLIPRFVDELGRRLGMVPVPGGLRFQPIDTGVVAERLVQLVEAGPSGRVPDLGGPEILDLDDMVGDYLRATGHRWIKFRGPYRGKILAAFRGGQHLAPEAAVGGRTYGEFLRELPVRERDPVATALRLIAAALFATMAWMLVSPSGFHDLLAGFGTVNSHFIRDTATFILPLAVALWMSASRPAWRVPVLGLALAQNGFHVVNHIADAADSVPAWHGPVNLAALLVLEFALWQMLRFERRRPAMGEKKT